MLRFFGMLWHGLARLWLGVATLVGSAVRHLGRTARDLEPEHRRDGAGLGLIGAALVVAAAVWWQLPGPIGHGTRVVVNGTLGLLGWVVPLLLLYVAWRNLRDPEKNGPAGRQFIGWVALTSGLLGVISIASGMPRPSDTESLQRAGGAFGFLVSTVLMDLLRTPYVVVPLLVLLGLFGLLVITATPVYQIPGRLRSRCWTACSGTGPASPRATPIRTPRPPRRSSRSSR